MRGFKKRPTARVTFHSDGEEITYRLSAPAMLWPLMVKSQYPPPAADDISFDAVSYWSRWNAMRAAEGLRLHEDGLPSAPPMGETREVWDAYGQALIGIFDDVGITGPQIHAFNLAMNGLVTFGQAEADALGKSSAPEKGISPSPES